MELLLINLSNEGLKLNVDQPETYKAQLIVFPHKARKVKKGNSSVHFLSLSTKLFFANNLIRQRTLRPPLLPMLPLHFLVHTSQRHLTPSQTQNVNSGPPRHSILPILTNDTKVLAKLRLLRQVKISYSRSFCPNCSCS